MKHKRDDDRRAKRTPSARKLSSAQQAQHWRLIVALWIAAVLLNALIVASLVIEFRRTGHAHLNGYIAVMDIGLLVLSVVMTIAR